MKEKCWGGFCEGSTAGAVELSSGDLGKLCTYVFFSLRGGSKLIKVLLVFQRGPSSKKNRNHCFRNIEQ